MYVLYYVSIVIVSFIFVHVYFSGAEERHLNSAMPSGRQECGSVTKASMQKMHQANLRLDEL